MDCLRGYEFQLYLQCSVGSNLAVISNFSESTQTERRHGTVKSESILKTHANKKNQLLQGNGSTEGTFFSRQLLFLAKGSDVAVNP